MNQRPINQKENIQKYFKASIISNFVGSILFIVIIYFLDRGKENYVLTENLWRYALMLGLFLIFTMLFSYLRYKRMMKNSK